jgi:hypothetical protein
MVVGMVERTNVVKRQSKRAQSRCRLSVGTRTDLAPDRSPTTRPSPLALLVGGGLLLVSLGCGATTGVVAGATGHGPAAKVGGVAELFRRTPSGGLAPDEAQRLLAEFELQRGRTERLETRNAELEKRLAESELLVARLQGGSGRLSSGDPRAPTRTTEKPPRTAGATQGGSSAEIATDDSGTRWRPLRPNQR